MWNELPLSKPRSIYEQFKLEWLIMKFLIILFDTLIFDILVDCVFTAVTIYGGHKVSCTQNTPPYNCIST